MRAEMGACWRVYPRFRRPETARYRGRRVSPLIPPVTPYFALSCVTAAASNDLINRQTIIARFAELLQTGSFLDGT